MRHGKGGEPPARPRQTPGRARPPSADTGGAFSGRRSARDNGAHSDGLAAADDLDRRFDARRGRGSRRARPAPPTWSRCAWVNSTRRSPRKPRRARISWRWVPSPQSTRNRSGPRPHRAPASRARPRAPPPTVPRKTRSNMPDPNRPVIICARDSFPPIAGIGNGEPESRKCDDRASCRQALAAGETIAAALVQAYLARIAAYDRAGPALNAVREVNPDAAALAAAIDAARPATAAPARRHPDPRQGQHRHRRPRSTRPPARSPWRPRGRDGRYPRPTFCGRRARSFSARPT